MNKTNAGIAFGKAVQVLEGEYKGFVGEVISSNEYNESSKHLVLRKVSKTVMDDGDDRCGVDEKCWELELGRSVSEEIRGPHLPQCTPNSLKEVAPHRDCELEADGFAVGDPVFLTSLKQRVDLNGRRGVICGFLKSGRYNVQIEGEANKAILGLNLRSSAYRADSAEIPDDFRHALSCGQRFCEIEAFAARMTTDMLIDKLSSRGWLMLKECTRGAKAQRKIIKKLAMQELFSAFSRSGRVGPRLFESQTASLGSRTSLCDHMWKSLSGKERAAWCSGLDPAASSDLELYFKALPNFYDEDIITVPIDKAYFLKSVDPAAYSHASEIRDVFFCKSVLHHLHSVSKDGAAAELPAAAGDQCSCIFAEMHPSLDNVVLYPKVTRVFMSSTLD